MGKRRVSNGSSGPGCLVKYGFGALLIAMTVALPLSGVLAHAEYIKSMPSDGSSLVQAPERVTAWFGGELEVTGSSMSVFDAQGRQINTTEGSVDLNDPDHASMVVSLPPGLAPGIYTVRWVAVSNADGHQGHETHGSFLFTVQ